MNLKSKAEQNLDELAASLASVQTDLTRLRAIETAAHGYLDAISDPAQRYTRTQLHAFAKARTELVATLGRTPAPPAPEGTLVTDFNSLKVGDVILRTLPTGTALKAKVIELLPTSSNWHLVEVLEGDKRYNCVSSDDVTNGRVRLLSRAPEAPAPQPAPSGTLVTSFEDLRAGDKVRIEHKSGDIDPYGHLHTCDSTVLGTLTRLDQADKLFPAYWCTTEGDCLDRCDVDRRRVWLLSRKPYVKDGRWVAQVGDRFQGNAFFTPRSVRGVATVVCVDDRLRGEEYTLQDSFGDKGSYSLMAECWEHVE